MGALVVLTGHACLVMGSRRSLMNGHRNRVLTAASVALLVATVAAAQSKPAAPVAPRPAAPRPSDEGAPATPRKLVSPIKGLAPVEYSPPQVKRDGTFVITTFRVKNVATAPIAGFKVDEFWYDKAGNPVTGAPTFRHRAPLQPGEIIEVMLKVPSHPQMNSNSYKFAHANGDIKPTRVAKLQ
jgi:hypothetical protein